MEEEMKAQSWLSDILKKNAGIPEVNFNDLPFVGDILKKVTIDQFKKITLKLSVDDLTKLADFINQVIKERKASK